MRLNPFTWRKDVRALHLDAFSTHRGRFIGLWTCLESAMDKANYYAWIYSDRSVAKKVPISLVRKIELFKKINRDLLPFEPLREAAGDLIARVDALVDDRHWFAHGYVVPKLCTNTAWTLIRHEFPRGSGGLVDLTRAFSEEEITELRTKVINLTNDFADYIYALAVQVEKHPKNDVG